MVRVVIPPGFTWDLGDGHPIEGPWELVTDHIQLTLEAGQPKETVINGEWVMHSDSTFYQSMLFTREETAITMPLAYSLIVMCMVKWLRRAMFPLLLLSPALAGAATWRLDAQTGVTISWPSGLSGAQVQGWAVFPGLGTVESTSAPTVTATSGGKPSVVSVPMITRSANWYYVITDGSSGSFESKTKLKWLDPYEVGSTTEPQSNESGNWSGSTPTTEAGAPISDPSNPVVDPTGRQKANGTFSNPFGHPAKPVLKVTPAGGGVPVEYPYPTLEPGQSMPWSHEQPGGFTYEVGWDLGDGVTVYPGGSGSAGTSAPVAGGGTGGTPTNTGGPRTTPSLTSPTAAPAGDVKAAVDRHAAITQQYGEAARTAAGITNNNLDKLKDLFGEAVDKLDSIDSKTGTGTGMDGVTIEGEALEHLQNIDGALNNTGSVTPPEETPDLPMPEGLSSLGDDNKSAEVAEIRAGMAGLGNALQGVVGSLGLGANYGTSPLVGNIVILGQTVEINLEVFAWIFDTIRALLLFYVSLNFVWRLLSIVRGAFVG